jgi:hypothetical protein
MSKVYLKYIYRQVKVSINQYTYDNVLSCSDKQEVIHMLKRLLEILGIKSKTLPLSTAALEDPVTPPEMEETILPTVSPGVIFQIKTPDDTDWKNVTVEEYVALELTIPFLRSERLYGMDGKTGRWRSERPMLPNDPLTCIFKGVSKGEENSPFKKYFGQVVAGRIIDPKTNTLENGEPIPEL